MTSIGLPVDEVEVVFRPYSKTYYGRYYPSKNEDKARPRVVLYPYEVDGSFMSYCLILDNGIHEFIHHLQYVSGSFIRRKGVMHNQDFWKLYNFYKNRAAKLGLCEEGGAVVGC